LPFFGSGLPGAPEAMVSYIKLTQKQGKYKPVFVIFYKILKEKIKKDSP